MTKTASGLSAASLAKSGAPKPSSALAQLDRAVHMLAAASTLEEVGHIRNLAKAAEEYARAEKLGDEAVKHATTIKLRAAKKAGEMLIRMAEQGERDIGKGGDRKSPSSKTRVIPTLADLGVTHPEADRFQRIAKLSEEAFEEGIANAVSETALAKGITQPRPKAGVPIGLNKRSNLSPATRLRKLADALGGYAAALPEMDLRGEDCSELLAEIDDHLLAIRRAVKRLRGEQ